MVNLHLVLDLAACVLFILAACPTGSRFQFQWFACAALALTLVL
jgi:hypothetical protein